MRRIFTLIIIYIAAITTVSAAQAAETSADTLNYQPQTVRHAGPFTVKSPVVLDSINNKQEKFSAEKLIETPISLSSTDGNAATTLASLSLEKSSLNIVSFDVSTSSFVKTDVKVTGAKNYKAYADGKQLNGKASLQPGYHTISVKFIADSTNINVRLAGNGSKITGNDAAPGSSSNAKRAFTMTENLGTRYVSSASMSPSGRWSIVFYSWYDSNNEYRSETQLIDTKTKQVSLLEKSGTWMPKSDLYYYTVKESGKRILRAVDPATGAVSTLSSDIPEGSFTISPTEDFLIMTNYSDGPAKEGGVYEIIHPDDRQPGWRNRATLSRFDLKTGLLQPLTYTYRNLWLSDISHDGKRILFAVNTDSLTQRPTTRSTYYELDLETLDTRMLVEKDGFISWGMYVGNTGKILFKASTEAFGGIGKRVPEGCTPNMFDYHLYLLDSSTLNVTPLTADDKTSIEDMQYSPADGMVYYTAQNGDSVSLYRLDMKTLKSVRIAQPMEVLNSLSIAQKAGIIGISGCSACVPYQAYTVNAKNLKTQLISDPNKEFYANVALGTVHPWKFTCKRGYEVSGHYYLPADFDPAKKYPVIVHYYGGCSPTSRRFGGGSHYPAHYWNALGYITFIVNPSGASGFGQEWASRHVNTMGEGVAEDIIEAVEQFAEDVPQVNKDKIGCVSASYGGFMTQCMMTKTDLFACGISHAGISDHTSYWGEGYWGYSYSEVSAANSYPWTRKDLFVDRSPLYNADKIHKPILFTHGTVDTNVPIGESIQMYTALKLLGVPTAFIMVEGENHGISNPTKRAKWINSMVAWFNKYLKDDDSWWKEIYTPKDL